jgi:hypothetical protein
VLTAVPPVDPVAVKVNVHWVPVTTAGGTPEPYEPLQATVTGFAPGQKAGLAERAHFDAFVDEYVSLNEPPPEGRLFAVISSLAVGAAGTGACAGVVTAGGATIAATAFCATDTRRRCDVPPAPWATTSNVHVRFAVEVFALNVNVAKAEPLAQTTLRGSEMPLKMHVLAWDTVIRTTTRPPAAGIIVGEAEMVLIAGAGTDRISAGASLAAEATSSRPARTEGVRIFRARTQAV